MVAVKPARTAGRFFADGKREGGFARRRNLSCRASPARRRTPSHPAFLRLQSELPLPRVNRQKFVFFQPVQILHQQLPVADCVIMITFEEHDPYDERLNEIVRERGICGGPWTRKKRKRIN